MFELVPTIEEMIERRAVEAMLEIERMVDEALIAAGFSREHVNRSRAQKRRHARVRKLLGVNQ